MKHAKVMMNSEMESNEEMDRPIDMVTMKAFNFNSKCCVTVTKLETSIAKLECKLDTERDGSNMLINMFKNAML